MVYSARPPMYRTMRVARAVFVVLVVVGQALHAWHAYRLNTGRAPRLAPMRPASMPTHPNPRPAPPAPTGPSAQLLPQDGSAQRHGARLRGRSGISALQGDPGGHFHPRDHATDSGPGTRTPKGPNRVGGGLATPVLPHHRTYSAYPTVSSSVLTSLVRARSRSNAVDACDSSCAAAPVPPSLPTPWRTCPPPSPEAILVSRAFLSLCAH
jgi:hypothetical protein